MENAIKLILSILPYNIYRDFDHRFSLRAKEHDDIDFALYVDVFPDQRIRAYYYGENSLDITLHEEYWNGERHETFSDGGYTVNAKNITQGRLDSWFYRVFRFDLPVAKEINIEGLEKMVNLVFSALDNRIVNDAGEQYELVVTICPVKNGFELGIHYMNIATRDSIWLLDGHIIEPDKVNIKMLKEDYAKEIRGFKPLALKEYMK